MVYVETRAEEFSMVALAETYEDKDYLRYYALYGDVAYTAGDTISPRKRFSSKHERYLRE